MALEEAVLPMSVNDAKKCIKGQLQLIESFMWLIDSYLAEFFACDLWSTIPPSWQKCLKELSIEEFHRLISDACGEEKLYSQVLPLSLQAFVTACHHFALPRKQLIKEADSHKKKVSNGGHVEHNFRKHVKLKKQYEVKYLSQLVKFIGDEVNCFKTVDVGGGLGHLSRYLAFVHKFKVVTIESEGHHKVRAEQFDMETIKDLNKTNLKDNNYIPKEYEKYVPPIHITKMIPISIQPSEFIRLVMTSNQEEISAPIVPNDRISSINCHVVTKKHSAITTEVALNKPKDSFILVGLHTCGDLSPTLLRTFVECSEVKGIVLVGCCYMNLTMNTNESNCETKTHGGNEFGEPTTSDPPGCNCSCLSVKVMNEDCLDGQVQINDTIDNGPPLSDGLASMYACGGANVGSSTVSVGNGWNIFGFPMSNFLRNQNYPLIGWDAFELACHNLDNYLPRLKDERGKLKAQCYRAVLEVVIRKVRPDMKNPQIRCQKIKGAEKMNFLQYAEIALRRIHIPLPSLDLYKELRTDVLVSQWKDVIMFFCLRLLLGPVIESLILLDRYLYLAENGYSASLCPVFDAKVSPRNFSIIAVKSRGDL